MRAVGRVLDLLTQLGEGEQSLTEMARAVGLSKATALRLLSGMSYRYFVVRDPRTGKYSLGPGAMLFIEKAQRAGIDAHELMRQHLRHLSEVTGETVTLHMRVDHHRVCIAEAESQQSIKYVSGVGKVEPVHVGAAGKVLLAALPDEERTRVVSGLNLTRITPLTITDRDELLGALEEVRAQGYATSFGERISGASCISVPVRHVLGVETVSLSVLGPTTRLPLERLFEFLPLLQETGRQMEQGHPVNASYQRWPR